MRNTMWVTVRLPWLIAATVITIGSGALAKADYTLYNVPGLDIAVMLPGTATIHPGGTATHHEGLASYFESPKHAAWSGVGAVDEARISYYRILEGDPVRGSLEFIVSDIGFLIGGDLTEQLAAYGQAWALTHYLINNRFDELIAFYREATKIETKDPREKGELLLKAFDEAFGDRAGVELHWRRYMRGLRTDMELLMDEGKL